MSTGSLRSYSLARVLLLHLRSALLHVLLECKLLFRLRWPMLLPIGAGIWVFMSLTIPAGADIPPSFYANAAEEHAVVQSLTAVLPALLGVLLMRRDLLSGNFDWSFGSPLPNALLVAAKFTAGILYMCLFIGFIFAGDAIAAARFGLPGDAIAYELGWLLLHYGMTYSITLALGMAIGALMPSRFALPVAFLGWVFGAFFLQIYALPETNWYMLKAFMLSHLLTDSSTFGNDGWTPALYGREYALLALFVAAFGLFLLTLATSAVRRIRPSMHNRHPAPAAAAALLLSIVAALPYAYFWMERLERVDLIRSSAPSYVAITPHEPYQFQLSSVSIIAERLPADGLRGNVTVTVPLHNGEPLPASSDVAKVASIQPHRLAFLLHPAMQIQSIAWDGHPADWDRSGERVFVTIPPSAANAAAGKIAFRYEGKLMDWARTNNSEGYWSFIHDSSVYLPGTVGWYPLPGGDSLFYQGSKARGGPGNYVNRTDVTANLFTDFDVTMKGFNEPLFATLPKLSPVHTEASGTSASSANVQRFKGSRAQSVDIIAGRFKAIQHGSEATAIVTTSGDAKRSELLLSELEQLERYYAGWLPNLQPVRQLWTAPIFTAMPVGEGMSDMLKNDTLLLSGSVTGMYGSDLRLAANVLLFGDLDTNATDWTLLDAAESQQSSIVYDLRNAIRYMHDAEQPHARPISLLSDSRHWLLIKTQIDHALEAGRAEQVKQVLSQLWSRGLKIPSDNLTLTMEDWNMAWNEEMNR
ncbi:hypothetical protein PaecuDRAFT_1257 [Paenibacillus curdlanolyticus YK9]|uniref:Uncharacterized protein n=1 Tax=Paenibacillus curdlanolyticus YK9 TaxID=717606 RepID=E0I6I5_9BACL|nr:ABC transporter permease [Paenibacillus curdlanolyticus]EFM11651.1 hypothetical protein PaecuDRAFT_1257 [Paenibacillus curdlanolyticus YK9]